jgi:hypothetical protein
MTSGWSIQIAARFRPVPPTIASFRYCFLLRRSGITTNYVIPAMLLSRNPGVGFKYSRQKSKETPGSLITDLRDDERMDHSSSSTISSSTTHYCVVQILLPTTSFRYYYQLRRSGNAFEPESRCWL